MGNLACPLDSSYSAMAVREAKQVAREKDGLPPVLFVFHVGFSRIPAVFILAHFADFVNCGVCTHRRDLSPTLDCRHSAPIVAFNLAHLSGFVKRF